MLANVILYFEIVNIYQKNNVFFRIRVAHYKKKKCIQISEIQRAGLFRKDNVMRNASRITWKERDFAEKSKNLDADLKIILLGINYVGRSNWLLEY